MNSISIIAFTEAGCRFACRLGEAFAHEEDGAGGDVNVGVYASARVARVSACANVRAVESLGAWTAERFAADDALVFVGAPGIAVRAIAPYVRDKFSDPAVVSVDEQGRHAVSLLSGHVGGANQLARAVARVCGGDAVVGTATDVNGVFAVDEWAREQGLAIVERDIAKEIAVLLLEGEPVGFAADVAVEGVLPAGVFEEKGDEERGCRRFPVGFYVGYDLARHPFTRTLHLVPRTTVVGAGCRRGAPADALRRAIDAALARAGLPPESVRELRSIDVKSDELALAQVAHEQGWHTRFLSAAQLAQVPGSFAASEFVHETVGVDNVCGRAAAWPDAPLLLDKQVGEGVTVALAQHAARRGGKGRRESCRKRHSKMGGRKIRCGKNAHLGGLRANSTLWAWAPVRGRA